MNVMDMMKQIHGNEVYTFAYMMDQAAVEQVEADYQNAWDGGRGFTFATMFARQEDSDAEMNGCADQILAALKGIVTKSWLSQYSRTEILTLCEMLTRGPGGRQVKVRLVADLEMDAADIVQGWSDLHQDESPVRLPDPDFV